MQPLFDSSLATIKKEVDAEIRSRMQKIELMKAEGKSSDEIFAKELALFGLRNKKEKVVKRLWKNY